MGNHPSKVDLIRAGSYPWSWRKQSTICVWSLKLHSSKHCLNKLDVNILLTMQISLRLNLTLKSYLPNRECEKFPLQNNSQLHLPGLTEINLLSLKKNCQWISLVYEFFFSINVSIFSESWLFVLPCKNYDLDELTFILNG